MTKKNTVFKTLSSLNVNEHTAKKGRLTYLSWANAWGELMKLYPDSSFRVFENEKGFPYFADETGVMTKVSVTVEGIERICWLPVMDKRNNAKEIAQTTMRDINDTIMRCLAKAIALHGLGLYIYKGEDLPDNVTELQQPEKKNPTEPTVKSKAKTKVKAKPEFDPDKHQQVFDWFMNYKSIPSAKEEGIPQIRNKFSISKKMETDLINALRVRIQSTTKIPF